MRKFGSIAARIFGWLYVYLYVLVFYQHAKTHGCYSGLLPLEIFVLPICIVGFACVLGVLAKRKRINRHHLAQMAPYITGLICTLIAWGYIVASKYS